MLQGTDKIWVENRSDAIVCYRIPETNYIRRFVAKEKKEIPMSELRAAVQIPGTRTLIKDDLIIHSAEAVKELLPEVEPGVFKRVQLLLSLLEQNFVIGQLAQSGFCALQMYLPNKTNQ